MHKKKWLISFVITLLVPLAFLLAGCTSTERVAPPATTTGVGLTISMGTVGRVDGLSIGLGSVTKESYVDSVGKTHDHLVAGLGLCSEGNPPVEKNLGIYAGQTVECWGYNIFAEEISRTLTSGHVTLVVQLPGYVPGGGSLVPTPATPPPTTHRPTPTTIPNVSGNWHGVLTSNKRDSATGKPIQWANYTMRLEQNGSRVSGTIYFSDISNPKTFDGTINSAGHPSFMFGVQGSRSISVDCNVQGDTMTGDYFGGGSYSSEYYSPGVWQGTRP